VLKTCEHCGQPFEGPAQARFCSDAHRKAASRSRTDVRVEGGQKQAGQENSVMLQPDGKTKVPQHPRSREELDADGRPTTLRGLMLAARMREIVLTEREEQKIRNHYGYASSEKRTLLERDAVAARIKAKPSANTRFDENGTPVEEPVGPAGLSTVAFPTQTRGDLAPTAEERAKLG
jgi:hypothetical protein